MDWWQRWGWPTGRRDMENSRKTHACTRKVIPIIQEAAASGDNWALGIWKIWKKNSMGLKTLFPFGFFYCVNRKNSQNWTVNAPNREIQTNRITGNSCDFFRTSLERRFDIRSQHSAPICILTHVLMRLYKTALSRWEVAQIDKSEQGVCISTHPYYWYTLMHRHRHMQSVTHPSPVFTCLYT